MTPNRTRTAPHCSEPFAISSPLYCNPFPLLQRQTLGTAILPKTCCALVVSDNVRLLRGFVLKTAGRTRVQHAAPPNAPLSIVVVGKHSLLSLRPRNPTYTSPRPASAARKRHPSCSAAASWQIYLALWARRFAFAPPLSAT